MQFEFFSKDLTKTNCCKRPPKNSLTDKILYQFSISAESQKHEKMKQRKLKLCDEITFQSKAFEIEHVGPQFNTNIRPTNGREYLMQMNYERERCPVIVHCKTSARPRSLHNIVTTGSKPIILSDEIIVNSVDIVCKKTPEWIDAQTCTFLKARSKISSLRLKVIKKYPHCDLNVPISVNCEKEWQTFCRTKLPLVSLMLRFNQVQLEILLEWLSKWLQNIIEHLNMKSKSRDFGEIAEKKIYLNKSGIVNITPKAKIHSNVCSYLQESDQDWVGTWIYGAFACLQLPLEPHVHSTLREIARSSILLRSFLESGDEKKSNLPYNSFIVLIVFVFHQYDFKNYI